MEEDLASASQSMFISDADKERFYEALAILMPNLTGPLTVHYLAQKVCTNPNKLNDTFDQEVHGTDSPFKLVVYRVV